MQPRCLHPLLADAQTTNSFHCFFLSCRRNPGIVFTSKNKIASLLKIIGILSLLFAWSRKGSERCEEQKTHAVFSLGGKTICRQPLHSLSTTKECQTLPQRERLSGIVLILNAGDTVHLVLQMPDVE